MIHTKGPAIALAGFERATLGSSGQHTNHYTTKATYRYFRNIKYKFIHYREYVIAELPVLT
jgi:hypothetical protein